MAKPQQPELARSGRGAVDPAAVKEQLTAPTTGGGENGDLGPIPEDQRPGHHPRVEQDKPSGEAFLEKLHEHAASADAPSEPEDDEVSASPESESERADRLAEAVGKPFEAAADLLQKVRDTLGD